MTITELPFVINNKYLKEYLDLINNYNLNEGYSEVHHIICKSFYKYLGLPVDNSANNLIRLLFKDHCRAHWLLYKCTTGKVQKAMANAFISMISFKSNQDLLKHGLTIADYNVLQQKIDNIRNDLNSNYWSEADIAFLKLNYSSKGQRYCADYLHRSIKAVSSKVSELGLKIARYFSEDELTFLKENFKILGIAECAKHLNRTEKCIATKASKLGLTSDQKYSDKEKQFLLENYEKMGPTWCAQRLNRPYENIKAYAAHVLHIKTLPQGNPVYCPELDKIFASISAAAREFNLSNGNICQVVRGKAKTTGGYSFIRLDRKEYYYEKRTH